MYKRQPKLIESSPKVIDEFANEPFAMFVKVLSGPLIVLFVSVCVPANVATVLSIANVTALPEPDVSIPVPPVNVNASLSKSIDNGPPLSAAKSKSCAVTCESTYALIDCCVASCVALFDDKSSSSSIAEPETAVFNTALVNVLFVSVSVVSFNTIVPVALGNDIVLSAVGSVSYTHLRAHETRHDLVCRLLLEKKN